MAPVSATRLLRASAALLLGVGALTTIAPAAGQTPPADAERARQELTERLADRTDGDLTVDRDATTGAVTFIGTEHRQPITTTTESAASPEAGAAAFVREFGPLFGADTADDLERGAVIPSTAGGATVAYQQVVHDVPVLAGELKVQLDGGGNVLSAGGELQPDLDVARAPAIEAATAATEAVTAIARDQGVDVATLTTSAPEQWIYAPDLLGGPEVIGGPRLVWRIEVTGAGTDRPLDELVLVDATTGSIALHFNQTASLGNPNRAICDNANARITLPCGPSARVEDQPPTNDPDIDAAYDNAGLFYAFFDTQFGWDSVNASGMILEAAVRSCVPDPTVACPMTNSFWQSSNLFRGQVYLGAGQAQSQDIVGHEFTHGVTEHTSKLFYYYESGAINESLSDIFGEFIDRNNVTAGEVPGSAWLIGEELPTGALRSMQTPSLFLHPDRMTDPLYRSSTNDNGGVHSNSGIGNKAAFLLVNGGRFNGRTVFRVGQRETGRIFYETNRLMLHSGSDYADLGRYLVQTCTNLIGRFHIGPSDCVAVGDAVAAVEMGADRPLAPPSAAPLCGPRVPQPTEVYVDDIESWFPARWTVQGTGTPWEYPSREYATSGRYSLHAPNPPAASNTVIAMNQDVAIPPRSILVFSHSYYYESFNDGGRVEYAVNGGPYTDAGPLFTFGAYDGLVQGRFAAFNGPSEGYRSSQLDLSSFAGQNVRFRFRSISDQSVGFDGWYIDDIRILACPSPFPRPDAVLRGPVPGARAIGNDLYNNTGASQRVTVEGSRGDIARFTLRVDNDGTTTEPIAVSGPRGDANLSVRYVGPSGANITDEVVAGTYRTAPLGPEQRESITLEVALRSGVVGGLRIAKSYLLRVASTVDPALGDTVKAKVDFRT